MSSRMKSQSTLYLHWQQEAVANEPGGKTDRYHLAVNSNVLSSTEGSDKCSAYTLCMYMMYIHVHVQVQINVHTF